MQINLADCSNLKTHLEKLHTFLAIAKAGSMSNASRTLHSSQAALSYSMRILESALEVELFHRGPRGVTLTQAGELLYQFADRVLTDAQTLENQLRNNLSTEGRFRIGTQKSLDSISWPVVLEAFAIKHPDVVLSMGSSTVEGLVTGIRRGEFHGAITLKPDQPTDLTVVPIYESEFRFYSGSLTLVDFKHPALRKRQIPNDALECLSIFTNQDTASDKSMPAAKFLEAHRIRHRQLIELNEYGAVIEMASKGLGLALLPHRMAESAVTSGKLRPVTIEGSVTETGRFTVCLIYLANSQGDLLLKSLAQALVENLGG